MKKSFHGFRRVLTVSLAGLLAAQLSLTAFADTADTTVSAGTSADTAAAGTAAVLPAVETYTMGSLLIEVEAVDVPAAAAGLTYNGKEQAGAALPDLNKKYKLRSGTKSAVKPGNYKFELELTEPLPENIAQQIRDGHAGHGAPATPSDYSAVRFYTWKDKSTAPKTLEWSIAPLKTKAPEGKKLTYSGKEQTGVESGSGYTLSGEKAVKPGTYKAKARTSEGYVWEDGSDKDLEIAWSIAPLKAKAPEGKKLTYSGKEQTGVESGSGYILSGEKAVKPGTYKAKARTSEGYVWEDGSDKELEIAWSIAPLKAKAPEGKKLTYNGKEQTGVEAPDNCGYTLTGNKETKAGSYKAVAKLAEGYVWEDGSDKDLEIAWSIERKSSSSGSSGGGGGGSSGTGQKGLMVVRPDGSVSTYGSTGSGSSYVSGSSVTSPGANAGSAPGQPSGTALVQSSPSASGTAAQPATPAPGSLSGQNAAPAGSKLPQDTGAAAASAGKQNQASGSGKSSSGSSANGTGSAGSSKNTSAETPAKSAASAASDVSKEHAETAETLGNAEKETLVAAEENSVTFEFGPAVKDDGQNGPAAGSDPAPAVHRPESFVTGLMSVIWKVLAVLGVLGIAGGVGYMVYSRKHDNWEE